MKPTHHRCDRARAWIAHDLDGELSDFERALLGAHLDGCAGCRAFAEGTAAVTARLRTARLEELEQPIALPRARTLSLRPLQAVAASLAVAAVGVGTLFGLLQPATADVKRGVRPVNVEEQLREQRRYQHHLLRLRNESARDDARVDPELRRAVETGAV